jgi:hypothetical protein
VRRKGREYVCVCICVDTGMGRVVPVVAHHMVCGVFGSLSGWCMSGVWKEGAGEVSPTCISERRSSDRAYVYHETQR